MSTTAEPTCATKRAQKHLFERESSSESKAAAVGIRQILNATQRRAFCFWTFARVLHYPERNDSFGMGLTKALDSLALVAASFSMDKLANQAHTLAATLEPAANHSNSALANKIDTVENMTNRMRADYCRMFYTEHSVKLHGASYLPGCVNELGSITRAYRKTGIKIADNVVERPDHIALEFDFLFYLASMELQAANKKDLHSSYEWRRIELGFWDEHLSEFATAFAKDLKNNSKCRFYQLISEILLQLDRQLLFDK